MFDKLLIANRGEIACRVAATARRMGIKTVAVYSDADAHAQHVGACDEAVHIGPAPAKESYLVIDRILAAARATGAQAIHPGYGFLSENEAFAQACVDAGVVFVGPPPAAIAAMGSKSAAKALMQRAGVPLVPGYHGDDQSPALLAREAERIGYPVLIKASAGGGGKGMRIVEAAHEFEAALASCQREAINAFGNAHVLIEKYLVRPRHIEVQVFADPHGQCVYLFERDCSVQRRHQKVLEEAPAPGLSAARRAQMGQAAVAAAQAVGYVGAGTVEFIVEADAFFFMEMNTRLQVEHPVTEMITGIDLVEWQLRVAHGEALPLSQAQLACRGHAIEARVYAENPTTGFLPSIGTLAHLRWPKHVSFTGMFDANRAAVRIDSGVREGDAITTFYDPMIAKLIVWGDDRKQALNRMADALAATHIVGVATNVELLGRIVASAPFASAQLDTGLIERHRVTSLAPTAAPTLDVLALAVAILLAKESALEVRSPWDVRTGWRMNHDAVRTFEFEASEAQHVVQVVYARDRRLRIGLDDAPSIAFEFVIEGHEVRATLGDRTMHATVVREAERLHVFAQSEHHVLRVIDALAHSGSHHHASTGRLTAPMPGKIVAHLAAVDAPIERGAPLLVMEAMKMEHTITAPSRGRVQSYLYAPGDQVAEGAELLTFVPSIETNAR